METVEWVEAWLLRPKSSGDGIMWTPTTTPQSPLLPQHFFLHLSSFSLPRRHQTVAPPHCASPGELAIPSARAQTIRASWTIPLGRSAAPKPNGFRLRARSSNRYCGYRGTFRPWANPYPPKNRAAAMKSAPCGISINCGSTSVRQPHASGGGGLMSAFG